MSQDDNIKRYYKASNYSETCPQCNAIITYDRIYTNNHQLTEQDLKTFKCPECGAELYPCDFCSEVHGYCHDECVLKHK